jgi:hypothetical protein
VPRKNQSFVVTGEDLPTGCQLPDFGANFKVVLMKMNVVLQEDRGGLQMPTFSSGWPWLSQH